MAITDEKILFACSCAGAWKEGKNYVRNSILLIHGECLSSMYTFFCRKAMCTKRLAIESFFSRLSGLFWWLG